MAALANFLTTMWCGPSADLFDFLPFCGQRIGEGLVMKLLGHDSPTLLSRRHAKTMLVDLDRAAVLGRLTATKRASGEAISYRIAQFIQFRDEKVVDLCRSSTASMPSNNCSVTILMRMTAIGSMATSSRCSR
jgi:hypothetical protein